MKIQELQNETSQGNMISSLININNMLFQKLIYTLCDVRFCHAITFFDLVNRYEQLNKLKDPLIELSRVIDWNVFADLISETTTKPSKSVAGRKPFDRVCYSRCWYYKERTICRMVGWSIKSVID